MTGTTVRHFSRGELELPREGAELPVLARGQQIGRFVLEPNPGAGVSLEARMVAVAIADQVGARSRRRECGAMCPQTSREDF